MRFASFSLPNAMGLVAYVVLVTYSSQAAPTEIANSLRAGSLLQ